MAFAAAQTSHMLRNRRLHGERIAAKVRDDLDMLRLP